MKICVTGGAGFIGSHIVDRLIDMGNEVLVIDNLSTGSGGNVNDMAQVMVADVTKDYNILEKELRGVNYVFHCAAMARIQPSIDDPTVMVDNIRGTLNVLMASSKNNVKRVIYSGSSSCYGRNESPLKEDMKNDCLSPYSLSKSTGEELCRIFSELYGMDTVSLRYFNVYGPRMIEEGKYATVIGIFLNQAKRMQALTIVGDGKIKRDFTYIDDVVMANIMAMNHKKLFNGDIINIGTGDNITIEKLALKISKNIKRIPERKGDARETLADNTKASEVLGWKPKITLDEGLKILMEK